MGRLGSVHGREHHHHDRGTHCPSGAHIVYIDFSQTVDIQVASADTIRIHNGNGSLTLAGNVTLIW